MQTPLSAIGSMRGGGRFNPVNGFEIFYVALSPATTLYEVQALSLRGAPKRVPPIIIFTVEYTLQRVVDLRAGAAQRALGVDGAVLRSDWKADVAAGRIPATHKIGIAARTAGVEALIVPSARHAGAANMCIIVDRLRRGSIIEIKPATGFSAGTTTVVEGKLY